MLNTEHLHYVTLRWSLPIKVDELATSDIDAQYVLFYLSQKISEDADVAEVPVYLGIATDPIADTVRNLPPDILSTKNLNIRIGTIFEPRDLSVFTNGKDDIVTLFLAIEDAIFSQMERDYPELGCNLLDDDCDIIDFGFSIKNDGYRSLLPKYIFKEADDDKNDIF